MHVDSKIQITMVVHEAHGMVVKGGQGVHTMETPSPREPGRKNRPWDVGNLGNAAACSIVCKITQVRDSGGVSKAYLALIDQLPGATT